MLYVALILIIAGIIVLVYSLLNDSAAPSDREPERFQPSPSSSVKEVKSLYDDEGSVLMQIGEGVEPLPGSVQAGSSADAAGDDYGAVLFEDGSGAVDYEGGGIDESLVQNLNRIKRIGSGNIQLDQSGLNFYSDKKLFRYDFHRIQDLKAGKKTVALFLKGGDTVKFFILNNPDLPAVILSSYKKSAGV
ncbi:MAG: hypothetical protein MUD12_09190 [Spirochaetes bacterium]|jgi:hypothetical protein|nr:hypothetical protein [Spirochaetota bacterium]